MNAKLRFLFVLIVALLMVSCGTGPVTQGPITQPPAATQLPGDQPAQISDLAVILVVDTFAKADVSQNKDTNCSVTPDGLGQQYGSREASAAYLGAPHGMFVYSDVLNQIRNSGEFNEPPRTEGGAFQGATSFLSLGYQYIKRADLYEKREIAGQGLLVVAVDTDGLKYDSIFNNLPATIDLFSNNNVQFGNTSLPVTKQFVVNMSFVFVPCEPSKYITKPLTDLNDKFNLNLSSDDFGSLDTLGKTFGSPDTSFYKYVNCSGFKEADCLQAPVNLRTQLQTVNDSYDKIKSNLEKEQIVPTGTLSSLSSDQIDNAVFNAFIVDLVYASADQAWTDSLRPLQKMLDDYYSKFGVVYVGAAGNFGYSFPLMPASWSSVYSISSVTSSQPSHAAAQPLGNNLALARYANWGEIQFDGDFWGAPDEVYGTSFAAPKFSFWAASSLLGSDFCPQNANLLPNGLASLNNTTEAPPWNNFDYMNWCLASIGPRFTGSAVDLSNAPRLADKAPERYSQSDYSNPGVLSFTPSLNSSDSVLWSYTWCTTTQAILDSNLSSINLEFTLDGKAVPLYSMLTSDFASDGLACRIFYTGLSDWSVGQHHLTTTATFTNVINDGTSDYQAGDYVWDYNVTVTP